MTAPPSADADSVERMAEQYLIRVLRDVRASHAADPLAMLKLHGAALERAAEKVFAVHDELLATALEQKGDSHIH